MEKYIGTKIKSLRKLKGLSQEQVADFLYISQSTYARIENGEGTSWALHLRRLSEFFETKPEELIKIDEEGDIQTKTETNGWQSFEFSEELLGKLLEQYEARLNDKEEIIKGLREKLKNYESK